MYRPWPCSTMNMYLFSRKEAKQSLRLGSEGVTNGGNEQSGWKSNNGIRTVKQYNLRDRGVHGIDGTA